MNLAAMSPGTIERLSPQARKIRHFGLCSGSHVALGTLDKRALLRLPRSGFVQAKPMQNPESPGACSLRGASARSWGLATT